LGFEQGLPSQPIIMSAGSLPSAPPLPNEHATPELLPVEIDGERRILNAEHELELRCGEASILLRANGTIVLRGRDIISWAKRRQRIRGGSVSIN